MAFLPFAKKTFQRMILCVEVIRYCVTKLLKCNHVSLGEPAVTQQFTATYISLLLCLLCSVRKKVWIGSPLPSGNLKLLKYKNVWRVLQAWICSYLCLHGRCFNLQGKTQKKRRQKKESSTVNTKKRFSDQCLKRNAKWNEGLYVRFFANWRVQKLRSK